MALSIPPPYLCLVTDRTLCGESVLERAILEAVEGGVNIVQLRDKEMPAKPLLLLAERLREQVKGRALLFINDRLDVALAGGADGVQLGEQSLPLEVARRVILSGPKLLLLACSVHSLEGAVEADDQGADLLVLGTVFRSRSHPGAGPLGVEALREVVAAVRAPVIGIGGISALNAAQVMGTGAQGVAVISAVLAEADPKSAARRLSDVIEVAWRESSQGAMRRQKA